MERTMNINEIRETENFWHNQGLTNFNIPVPEEFNKNGSHKITGDGSITPTTHIHESAVFLDKDKTMFATPYAYANDAGEVQSHVVRFGINAFDTSKSIHPKATATVGSTPSSKFNLMKSYVENKLNNFKLTPQENTLLHKALDYLEHSDQNTVILDIYKRTFDEITTEQVHKKKTKNTQSIANITLDTSEIHSVILLKSNTSNKYFVIDPNKTAHSCILGAKNLITGVELIVPSKQCEIYVPKKEDVGNSYNQWRDCIDIAVKLAFLFNESEAHHIPPELKNFSISDWNEVKLVANKLSIDKNIIEKLDEEGNIHNNSSAFRIKQTSDIKLIKAYSELLKSGAKLFKVFDIYEDEGSSMNLRQKWCDSFKASFKDTLSSLKTCLKESGFHVTTAVHNDVNHSTDVIGELEEGVEQ